MVIHAADAEKAHLMRTAEAMAAAARTAPKTKGADFIETLILEGEELEKLAAAMETVAQESGTAFFTRDANCIRRSGAVLVVGIGYHARGLGDLCGYCGLGGCSACTEQGAACVFDSIDLGIALGSAVSIAADNRVDTRIMFSAGVGVKKLVLLPEEAKIVFGIPLSISGKSPYFDR